MLSPRQYQIIAAMQDPKARQAATVSDSSLREAVRAKLIELATAAGKPLQVNSIAGLVAAALHSVSRTLIFDTEVPVALEMGAAGELPHEGLTFTQTNISKWITAYACSGDRRGAQEHISLQAARDQRRADAVTNEEKRRDWDENGLRRAWETFVSEGTWGFRAGYAAALYAKIGTTPIRALLSSGQIAQAKLDARDALRRDDPRRYRTMPEAEIDASPTLTMYWKAQLVRVYFEALRSKALTIDWKPETPAAV